MAISCDDIRTNLARQTPVYDKVFLKDFISDMLAEPYVGRHTTEEWTDGKDELFYDKIHFMQPNYFAAWQRRSSAECADTCQPPRTFVGYGTTRDSAFTEQIILNTQRFCLDQLRMIPNLPDQMREIYRVMRKMPLGFMGDFIRTRSVAYHDTLQIAGSSLNTFSITSGNTSATLQTINLGSNALLPTSELTWPLLRVYSSKLGMQGYDAESGLSAGMRNLITHSDTYWKLVGLNPELTSKLRVEDIKKLSPLYKPNMGINAEPFGMFAPTFDEQQVRFQIANGTGLLQRVLPYYNSPATTGEEPIVNPAYLKARYAISTIVHPKGYRVYTMKAAANLGGDFMPQVNSAMYGKWDFVNPKGIIRVPNPDGTYCDLQNDTQWNFYWLCLLQTGLRYDQRKLIMPILHLIDGDGSSCIVDSPVCGSIPQYENLDQYNYDPIVCQEM